MKTLVGLIAACALAGTPAPAETRAVPHTPERLHEMSTLVFEGTVTAIATVEEYKKSFPTSATVAKVLKGKLDKKELSFKHKGPGKWVIFKEEFTPPKVGQDGTFYIQDQHGTLVLVGYLKKPDVSLKIRRARDEGIRLMFKNTATTEAALEIPVEGAGDCDKYFDIQAVTREGKAARKSMLYAPSIPPYGVKLKPHDGLYVHQRRPSPYLNGTRLKDLRKLRVKYTNPVTGEAILSDWLVLEKGEPAEKSLKRTR
jgi:hypothetical protein